MTRAERQRGFTLVEMMVGIAILSVVSVAMAGTFLVATRAVSNEARVIAADEAVSAGNPLTLTYGSPAVTVVYSIDNNRDLVRTVAGAPGTAARGVTSISINAVGCYATVTIQPSATGAVAATLNVSNRPGGCW